MDMLDFNKHDINIFINETLQKYAGDYSKLLHIRLFFIGKDRLFNTFCWIQAGIFHGGQ